MNDLIFRAFSSVFMMLFFIVNVEAVSILDQPLKKISKKKVDFTFVKSENNDLNTLILNHSKVSSYCRVLLNDVNLGWLDLNKTSTELIIPSSELKEKEQSLTIEIHENRKHKVDMNSIEIVPGLSENLKKYGKLNLEAKDLKTSISIYTHFTLADQTNKTTEYKFLSGPDRVMRKGHIYTNGTSTVLLLKPGQYRAYASKGMEYSVDKFDFELKAGTEVSWVAILEKELDLGKYYSADTHIHTFTHSRHGNAAIEERELTFMGEDLDIAIMTDHNHNTTVKPHMHHHETFAIDGNEVTTPIGHINTFPVDLKQRKANHKLKTWRELHTDIMSLGSQFSILNHPRWPKVNKLPFGPFDKLGFKRETATFNAGVTLPFEAIELINSDTRTSDSEPMPLYVFEDWLALRNAGSEVLIVGSSDSHRVDTSVGLGRTYLRIENPSLTEPAIVQAFKEGKMITSLGMFCEMKVDGQYLVGDKVPLESNKERLVSLKLQAPSWIEAKEINLYANGKVIKKWIVNPVVGKPTIMEVEFKYTPSQKGDYLVGMAMGGPMENVFAHAAFESALSVTNPIVFE